MTTAIIIIACFIGYVYIGIKIFRFMADGLSKREVTRTGDIISIRKKKAA